MGGRGGSGRGIVAQPPAASSDPVFSAVQRSIRSDPSDPTGSITSLERVRSALSDLGITDRDAQDTQILRLARARQVLLVPASNQKVMSDAERAAEIIFGNERKAHIMIP